MVFLGGPRQVGKTTLARSLLVDDRGYLNWDNGEHRELILRRQLPTTPLLVLDEIHKYRSWRNYLKGHFDVHRDKQQILVTGSARLDYYRFGGDSLQGRYHFLRLHPLSVAELQLEHQQQFDELLSLGGFPEPFFSGSQVEAKRWSREYRQRLIRDDLTSLEQVKDVGQLELLMLRLPDLVGSPLSLNALREDLQVSHKTLSRWVDILDRLYAIYRLSPFGAPKIRAVKKEQKHYHMDWTVVPELPQRFENLVASHLLKWVQFEEDTKGRELELRYFRDVDRREVDFVIVEGRATKQTPILMVECKWSDTDVDSSLIYLKRKFPQTPAWQISAVGHNDYLSKDGIRVSPAISLLATLV